MKKIAMALLALLISVPVAHADSVVTIAATNVVFIGNADETVSLSFNWDVTTKTLLPGTMVLTASGPLGPFVFAGGTGSSFNWTDGLGDDLQINNSNAPDPNQELPAIGGYGADLLDIYCVSNYCLSAMGTGYQEGSSGFLTVTDPPSPTPEPNFFLMLLCGIAMVVILRFRKSIAVVALALFLSGVASAQAPDFSKITSVTVEDPSQNATAYDWKVDDWPADPNVHQQATFTMSSVTLNAGGWNMIADCTNPVFRTAPCKTIPVGVHDVEWKGRVTYRWQVYQGGSIQSQGQILGPSTVTVIVQNGKKKSRITYHIDSFNRCDASTKTCVFFDVPLADMAD